MPRKSAIATEPRCARRAQGVADADPNIAPAELAAAPPQARPRIVIIGGGFGGIACAKALARAAADVTVIDRNNYHLFQPLLYQVATAALSPADIAEPIRKLLRRQRNAEVVMAEVTGIDTAARMVLTGDGARIPYDRLVIATGSVYNYFGHADWERHAPGLKTIDNARAIRTRVLMGFECAEREADPARREALMTSVIIGGGPTGVEMAGSIAELARHALARDFRHIDPREARVVLVEAGPRVLAAFPEALSAYALRRLEKLGVEVRTGEAGEEVTADGVRLPGGFLPANAIVWGAGIRASPAAQWLGVAPDRAGRIPVNARLEVAGHPGIYALGDTVAAPGPTGAPLPGLAQVAKQQGEHLGRELARELRGSGGAPAPFVFRNRGNAAIIGRHAAVFDFGKRRLKGTLAWLLWAVVHVYLLVAFEQRVLVSIQWLWRYVTYQRGARLITNRTDASE
ncbi:NAD(P)/FAD-dependent oxidoreductase [Erythrobacter sp. NE805]|uniref:NAD(P)/FAD-dependent oxidoreductase n=1 Tax=Erythrobacter sp. NE805 TaxID=3389875 RepID=UPI00396B2ED4